MLATLLQSYPYMLATTGFSPKYPEQNVLVGV
jgi:hypothetical protein